MIEIKVMVEVEVENHAEIVRSQKGDFWGALSGNSFSGFFINPQVDVAIRDQLKEALRDKLPGILGRELVRELGEKGVRASVNVKVP